SGTTERVSVSTGGTQADSDSVNPSISADGRFVVFESAATNLVAGDTNGTWDVFVRDRQSGTTERVSVATGGAEGNSESNLPSVSPGRRFVVFETSSSTLVAGDTATIALFVAHPLTGGTTDVGGVPSGWPGAFTDSGLPSISADGRFVTFSSDATNLVA